LTAQSDQVAAVAGAAPGEVTGQVVGAQRVAGRSDLAADAAEQLAVDQFPDVARSFVKVEDLDEVSGLAGQLLVAECIHMELVTGHVLGLGALGRLKVDDRGLVGVELLDEVDPPLDRDSRRNVHLDLLLGVEGPRQGLGIVAEVPADRLDRSLAQLAVQLRVGERRVQLQQLTREQLAAFYGTLRTRTGRPLAAKTVRGIHTFVHKLLADAVEANLLARNPADGVHKRLPKVTRRPASVWTLQQTRAFLDHVRDDRLYAAFLVFATTGARRSEVLGLRWTDVDLDAATLAVTGKLVLVGGQPRLLAGTKTERSTRAVDLDPATVATLRAHRTRQLAERLAWGAGYTDHGLIFCQENGEPLHPGRFLKAFGRLVRAAGLPPVRLHDLRHGWATAALVGGVHPKVVQERLGHSSIAITMNLYSHVLPGMGRQAASQVTGAILGADVINR
jgi:integrase